MTTEMHPGWRERFDAAVPAPEPKAKPELPWTLFAWEATMGRYGGLPGWTLAAAAEEPPPATAIYHRKDSGWQTLADITSTSAQNHIRFYAETHGHTIPQEVLDAWEFQAETARLVEKVTDEAKRFATSMAPALRNEAELIRWVGNRLGDLAYEMGVGA